MVLYVFKRLFFCLALVCSTGCARNIVLKENNPTGIVLENEKAIEVQTSVGNAPRFRFWAKNVPPNKKFIVFTQNLLEAHEWLHCWSDSEGRLFYSSGEGIFPFETARFGQVNVFPGEPMKIWLVSEDQQIGVSTTLVAFPIEVFGQNGAHVSLVRKNWNSFYMTCSGSGFDANEQLELVSRSDTKNTRKNITCVDGSFSCVLEPPNKQTAGESVQVEVHRADGEVLQLEYKWGKSFFNPDGLLLNTSKMTEDDFKKLNTRY